jgi:CheY-like chemotaxis protein
MPEEKNRSWTVLVVDDNPETGKLLTAELRGPGLKVLQATSAEQATRMIMNKETRPHLILLDVIMPGVDGKKFCRFIKSNEMFRDIKVVFCSSMKREELKKAAEECRADGFLHKEDVLGQWVTEQLKAMEQSGPER